MGRMIPGPRGPVGPAGATGPAGPSPTITETTLKNLTHTFMDYTTLWAPGLSVSFTCSTANETALIMWHCVYTSDIAATGMSYSLWLDGVVVEGWDGTTGNDGVVGGMPVTVVTSLGDCTLSKIIALIGLGAGSHTVEIKFGGFNTLNHVIQVHKAQIIAQAA